jgi:sugar-specific transcriptional regulator TrmB
MKALIDLGLSRSDAEVYVYLAKKGSQKVVDLSRALNCDTKKIYTSLKNLQTRGLVTKENKKYSALSFDEALDLLIRMEKKQAQAIQESKEELLHGK